MIKETRHSHKRMILDIDFESYLMIFEYILPSSNIMKLPHDFRDYFVSASVILLCIDLIQWFLHSSLQQNHLACL